MIRSARVVSNKLEKNTLNFMAKAWYKLARRRLCPTIGDNVLSLVCVALIRGFMARYEFDIREFLA